MRNDGDCWSTITIFLFSEVATTFRLHSEHINQAARNARRGDSKWLTLSTDVSTARRPGADCFPGFCLALNVEQFGSGEPELLELHRGKFAVDANELTGLPVRQRP